MHQFKNKLTKSLMSASTFKFNVASPSSTCFSKSTFNNRDICFIMANSVRKGLVITMVGSYNFSCSSRDGVRFFVGSSPTYPPVGGIRG